MRDTIHIEVAEGVSPFAVNTTAPKRAIFRKFINLLKALISGGLLSRGTTRPTAWAGTAQANAIVTCASVANADTVTLNGTALTATQHHSRGTITIVIANTDVDDTVTIQGVVFTAKNAEDTSANQFDISGTATAAAVSLVACIDAEKASIDSDLYGLITAKNVAGVVTIRAVEAGTGGDAITLVSSDADGLAVSPGATLGGGAAVASNQFDFGGSDTETATALAAAVAASGTALVSSALVATNYAGTIALSGVTAGEYVDVGSVRFTAVSLTGNGINEFAIGSTDTNDATSLKNAINAHPFFKDKLLATSSSGTVTVRPIPNSANEVNVFPIAKSGAGLTVTTSAPTAAVVFYSNEKGLAGNQATIATGNGTRLAITGGLSRLAGGTRTAFTF